MEHEPTPPPMTIQGEVFDVIKQQRLLPGMVLKSTTRSVFARLGQKQSTLEEQIHTVSLYERGFPVAKILESGTYGSDEWYFTEESLGDETFHTQFTREYSQNGEVSAATFQQYLSVLEQYISAQFAPNNHMSISAQEFVETAIPDSAIQQNYLLCGKNFDRYRQAIDAATDSIRGATMGVLQFDLNPYNILERGMIDFELVGYGPLGYDALQVSLWHRWFTSDQTSRYAASYYLSEEQITTVSELVIRSAAAAGIPDPTQYMQEFLLIKTAWAFTSSKSILDEPQAKRSFYEYRAGLLEHCVETYLAGETIDPLGFPDFRA